MARYYSSDGITIHYGNCLEVMASMPADSVDAIITDGPYGLSFMGKGWDHAVPGVEYWSEMLRVAKPGAHLLSFGGTRLYHRMICAIEDSGWQIRDCIMWVYGSGFPKSHSLGKSVGEGWEAFGTALKPAWEPICLARKPLSEKTIAANALVHGTGGLNIDGCRIPVSEDDEIHAKNPHTQGGFGHGDAAVYGTSVGAGAYNPRDGRWPANLIHDGSEEVGGLFPVKKSTRHMSYKRGGGEFIDSIPSQPEKRWFVSEEGSASRFFYCAKTSKKDRGAGNTHPTVKPRSLMRWLACLIGCQPGSTILDPFMGSGSTLLAARDEGLRSIGIEINEEYCEIAKNRIQ